GHLRRRRDLLHGGALVALLAEEPERVLPEGSTRPGLLPLAQALWPVLAHGGQFRHASNSARSAPFSSGTVSAAPTFAVAGAPASVRCGRKMTASMALASAIPAQAQSMVSIPVTNACRTESSSGTEPALCAIATPATTLLLAADATASGRPVTTRWLRYTELSTVPRTATPMVAPTWRMAEIRAEPAPLVSADRADRAAFIACGMASPRPRPNTANQAAANPVPLLTVVVAPNPRVTAMSANPTVTRPFTLASGALAVPPAACRGEASRVLPIMPITMPPIIGSSRSPLPIAFTPRTSWKYWGIAKKMPNIANETSVASMVPQVKPADQIGRAHV